MTYAPALEYLLRVNAVLDCWSAVLDDWEIAEVRHLIEYGEPASGMRSLA